MNIEILNILKIWIWNISYITSQRLLFSQENDIYFLRAVINYIKIEHFVSIVQTFKSLMMENLLWKLCDYIGRAITCWMEQITNFLTELFEDKKGMKG